MARVHENFQETIADAPPTTQSDRLWRWRKRLRQRLQDFNHAGIARLCHRGSGYFGRVFASPMQHPVSGCGMMCVNEFQPFLLTHIWSVNIKRSALPHIDYLKSEIVLTKVHPVW